MCVLCAQEIWMYLRQLNISTYQGCKITRSTRVGRHFSTAVVLIPIWTSARRFSLRATLDTTRKTAHEYSNIKHFIGECLVLKIPEMVS
jgi:hypothetical protein